MASPSNCAIVQLSSQPNQWLISNNIQSNLFWVSRNTINPPNYTLCLTNTLLVTALDTLQQDYYYTIRCLVDTDIKFTGSPILTGASPSGLSVLIQDVNGTNLEFVNSPIPAYLTMLANKNYTLRVTINKATGYALPINENILMLQGYQFFSVSSFFPTGIQTITPLPDGVTVSYDSYGQPTYSFTNFITFPGQEIDLAFLNNASSAGQLNVNFPATITNASSYQQSFNANNSIYVPIVFSSNSILNGALQITITNVGTIGQVDTLALYSSSSVNSPTIMMTMTEEEQKKKDLVVNKIICNGKMIA